MSSGTEKIRLTLTALGFIVLIFGIIAILLLNIGVGSANISVSEVLKIIFGMTEPDDTKAIIVMRIRLPRALAAAIGGASLAIAGLLLQTFFSNPIVEPYVLGISSGATLFVGLVLLGGFTFGLARITPMMMFFGAFVGAMIVMVIVLVAARKVKSIITLLIIGLMVGYLCSASNSIMTAFADRERLQMFSMWTMGSFAGTTWEQIRLLYSIIVPMLVFAFLLAKPLNALAMGDNYASSMGINVKYIRYLLILISGCLTAATTAFAGPVSFIGLAVPHICRVGFRTLNNRILIPAAAMGGALMASICDFIARNIVSPLELPLAAVTSIIGAPIVVYLLTRRELT
ncbi:MAG: iron ABC transporter permease [Coriobacteriia bacterium]|nr:iron ABC transporter permease [Coriobacteriia bacterium]